MDVQRLAAGALSGLLGGLGVMLLVVVMNRMDRTPDQVPDAKEITFDVPEKRKPPTRKRRPKPRPKPTPRTPPPPIPQLSQAIGGVDVGLWAGSAIDLSDGADSLLGDAAGAVMTADTVDSLPRPTQQSAVSYPAAARSRGVEGFVRLRLDFDARGGLTNVAVAESSPPGVFDQAATQTVRMWRFSPATFQGSPVPVNGVEITIEFNLEQGK